MNKARRKALDEVISKIEEAKELLENLQAEEEEYRDNMPENLQGSERYEAADAAVDNMSSAVEDVYKRQPVGTVNTLHSTP